MVQYMGLFLRLALFCLFPNGTILYFFLGVPFGLLGMDLTFLFSYTVLSVPLPFNLTFLRSAPHLKFNMYFLLSLAGMIILLNILNDFPPKKKKKKNNAGFDFYYD